MKMIFIFFIFVYSEKQYPSIRFTKNGIFNWFNALSLMKKPFNNKKIFGFRANSSEPDLSMIVNDIVNYLNISDLNVSGKIDDQVNLQEKTESNLLLLSSDKCSGRTGNVHQLCELFNTDIKFENIGISEKNADILIANVAGYIPTNLFFVVVATTSVVYYIVQLFLSCFYCKPKESSPPNTFTIILFFSADILVFISAVLFCCSFKGIDNFSTTLTSLDTVVPRITYSIALSFSSLLEEGIPNGLDPIFQLVIDVLNSVQTFISNSSNSFLNPTEILLSKMTSRNESDMGVFPIYNDQIQPIANDFYNKASEFPKLSNISKFFFKQNFTLYQTSLQDLYDSELSLSQQLTDLVSLFEYINSVVQPLQEQIFALMNETIGDNKTIAEAIEDLKESSLGSFTELSKIRKEAKEKSGLWTGLKCVYFIAATLFVGSPVVFGLAFSSRSKFSVCIASTAAVCPFISTLLMLVCAFFMTGFGFALVAVSNQLEQRIDGFIDEAIDRAFPGRRILMPTVNATKQTNGVYRGVLEMSDIIFPKKVTNFARFVEADEDAGIASALNLNEIVNMGGYGEEIGLFIEQLGMNFTLPPATAAALNEARGKLSALSVLPKKIDGFFNWLVPMSMATDHLRQQVEEADPQAVSVLSPYLDEIDHYSAVMNDQFSIALAQVSDVLPQSLTSLDGLVAAFIHDITRDLSRSVISLMRNVYTVVDSVKAGLVTGPYSLVRNVIFYDLSSTCAYMSASATLMSFGLVVVALLLWLRRRGMAHDGACCGGFFCCVKSKVENENGEACSNTQKSASKASNKKVLSLDDQFSFDSSNDYAPTTDGDESIAFYASSLRSSESTS